MIGENNLTYEEYVDIIRTIGWKCPSKRLLEKSLKNSMTAKYVINDKTVAMARFVTDGVYIFLVVIVNIKDKLR